MNNMLRRQIARCGDHRLPDLTAALSSTNLPALLQNSRATSPMDSTVYATTTQQGGIRSVHNGILFNTDAKDFAVAKDRFLVKTKRIRS